VNVSFAAGKLHAIVGPSGCGKTTLVKAMLGLMPHKGRVFLGCEQVRGADDLTGRVGFAPQFSIASPKLTVRECLHYTYCLAVSDKTLERGRIDEVLELIGLAEHADKLVQSLSGGQLRRLGLGQELMLDPPVLVCDEVTSGLDPSSEDVILKLLRQVCDKTGKTVICIIHNLGKLPLFDSVTFVYGGHVLFQGAPDELCAHFGVNSAFDLYGACEQKPLEHWLEKRPAMSEAPQDCPQIPPAKIPAFFEQLTTLLQRRIKLFFRDTGTLILTLLMAVGFPLVVILFAWDGLPQIQQIALSDNNSARMEMMQQTVRYAQEAASLSLLVTGLILFQIVLLGLMASNNGSREIAAERALYEKERLIGVRPSVYAFSKFAFVGLLSLGQALLMTLIVKYVCQFPGSVLWQFLLMWLSTFSMSLVCLGFSAVSASSERSSLLSIYLVGFQLPLCGVILALPKALEWVFRPFINAYWTWGGTFATMKETTLYDAFRFSDNSWIPSPALALGVLVLQGIIGAVWTAKGLSRRRWN